MSTLPKLSQYLQVEYKTYLVMRKISTKKAIDMFFYLAHKMTLNDLGRVKISNKTIQNEFGVCQSRLSRNLKILKNHNMLKKIPLGYMLNPEMVWKGDRGLLSQAIAVFNQEEKAR